MKVRLIFSFFLLCTFVSCSWQNLLNYKYFEHYEEKNFFVIDKDVQLSQSICYNKPHIIDEEHCYDLNLIFLDSSLAILKKKIDLETDTSIVKVNYGIFSIWNWRDENNHISGHVEILAWNNESITLKEDILVVDHRRNNAKKLKGKRVFKIKKE